MTRREIAEMAVARLRDEPDQLAKLEAVLEVIAEVLGKAEVGGVCVVDARTVAIMAACTAAVVEAIKDRKAVSDAM